MIFEKRLSLVNLGKIGPRAERVKGASRGQDS